MPAPATFQVGASFLVGAVVVVGAVVAGRAASRGGERERGRVGVASWGREAARAKLSGSLSEFLSECLFGRPTGRLTGSRRLISKRPCDSLNIGGAAGSYTGGEAG